MNLVQKLAGYKTYVVGCSLIVYACMALYYAKIDGNTFAELIYAALGAMALRSGIKTEVNKVAEKLQPVSAVIEKEIEKSPNEVANPQVLAKNMVVDLLQQVIDTVQKDTENTTQPLG